MIKDHVPDIFLVGNTVPDNIPHRDANTAKKNIKYQAVGQRYLNGKVIKKVKNGKVDPHDEGPQTEINGNGSCIEKNRVLHAPQFVVQ
jgi:hypothetical protein